MEFNVLGPVEALADGVPVRIGRRQERCLLALLLLEPGRYVSQDRLADLLWDSDPPQNARAVLRTYATRLRAALSPFGVVIASESAGFCVDVDPQSVDAQRFKASVGRARGIGDPGVVAEVLREAMSLWRGPLLAGVATDMLRGRIGVEYDDLRIEAITMLAQAQIEGGHAESAIELLHREVAADLSREALVGQLMAAYRAAGRQSAAVALYHETRRHLIDTLGLQPGPELRARYAELLADDTAGATVAPRRRPAQLPASVRRFSGRAAELQLLDALAGDEGAAVVISAMSGLAGIGKTALALQWAHRARDRFPDGQLYIDLRGFDPHQPPLDPADALRVFLDALGVSQPPPGLDTMAARYRSIVADRRMLVLLDNARDAAQVQDLLPGTPSCLTLITSRNQMTALVALSGARVMTVDRLPDADAVALLGAHVAAVRLMADAKALNEILARCAGLPLALSIVAAQLATNPAITTTELAAELAADGPLARLDAGEPAADVRSVFAVSYRAVRPPVAQAFRLLGLHPLPAFDAYAAASLLGIPTDEAERVLTELILANLAVAPQPGWYAMHDLVHAYAGELAATVDSDADREQALHRLTDHYTHTGFDADRLIEPGRDPLRLDPPAPGGYRTPLATVEEAMSWYAMAKPAMLALFWRAVKSGADKVFWRLGNVMSSYLDRISSWAELEAIQIPILEYGRRSGNKTLQQAANHSIARAHIRRGQLDEAMQHLLDGLRLAGDDVPGERAAPLHNEIATLYAARGDNAQALAHVQKALGRLAGTKDRTLLARTLNGVGWFHAQLGAYDQALVHCTEAARIQHETGDLFGEADTIDSIGYAHASLGNYAQARACFQEAYEIFQRLGDALQTALVLDHRGDAEAADGDLSAAQDSWHGAVDLFDQINRPEAESVRAKLARLAQAPRR